MATTNKWVVKIYDNYGTYDDVLGVSEFTNGQDALKYMHWYNKTYKHTYAAFPVEVEVGTSIEDLFLPF